MVNQTSTIEANHLVDSLVRAGFIIQTIFAPEHGFRGEAEAGAIIKNQIDEKTGIQVVSLYGKKKMPDSTDLSKIDLLVFDIQDVGVRFYTYISTLHYVMDAAAMFKIPLLVLDRPNPHGHYIDGPVLEPSFKSFVGMHQVPIVHGLTIGEYAKMINGEGWLTNQAKCKLEVIQMENYNRNQAYVLPIPPSPNLPNMQAVRLYPSICLFEGTTISLGRGTDAPFQWIGHPNYPVKNFSFKPVKIPGKAENPPHLNQVCFGLDFSNLSTDSLFLIKKINLNILISFYNAMPNATSFFNDFFDKLAGNSALRNQILAGKSEIEIRQSWEKGLASYQKTREKYIIYK